VTDTDRQLRAARTRHLTAARRSLKLVADALPDHVTALADGAVPEDGFLTHALKYEQARMALALLDSLTAEPAGEDVVLVSRSALDVALQAIIAFNLAPSVSPDDGSPLGQLMAAAWPAQDGQETGRETGQET
jgi:hypothetical protein